MLVYGLISPHPPIIIPAIGGEEAKKVQATIHALEHAANQLAATKPSKLILISPHKGHGFEVPMHYLGKHLPKDTEVEEILVTEPSYEHYYELGKNIGRHIQRSPHRYVIVASGDLSHVLKADGPYGYHPSGPVLDELIVRAVRERDAPALLGIDPGVLEQGAECGLRSILFLLGALEGTAFQPRVRSYEGPFGVGYLVATFASPADAEARTAIVKLARKAVRQHLRTGQVLEAIHPKLPVSLPRTAGVFVSLHRADGELRGCIGTITPTKASLAEEVAANAIAAATQDPRFSPLTLAELEGLHINVDVLGPLVLETNLASLNAKQYGVAVAASDGRQGVLLPDLEGVDTVTEQLEICRQKGHIRPNEPVKVYKFTVARYQEELADEPNPTAPIPQ